jgi:hypothetical protein
MEYPFRVRLETIQRLHLVCYSIIDPDGPVHGASSEQVILPADSINSLRLLVSLVEH